AEPLRVETDAGVKTIRTHASGSGRVARVTVDMGQPVWEGRRIPVAADGEVVERPLEVDGRRWAVTCVSMGNPHCVVFVDDDVAGLALAGGELEIDWRPDDRVLMTGDAVEVFEGQVEV